MTFCILFFHLEIELPRAVSFSCHSDRGMSQLQLYIVIYNFLFLFAALPNDHLVFDPTQVTLSPQHIKHEACSYWRQ